MGYRRFADLVRHDPVFVAASSALHTLGVKVSSAVASPIRIRKLWLRVRMACPEEEKEFGCRSLFVLFDVAATP